MGASLFVCVILVAIAIALFNASGEEWGLLGAILLCIVMVWSLMAIVGKISYNQEVVVFQQQKAYIETHVPKNDIEDAALTQKKLEYNGWLYSAQWGKNAYGIFSSADDRILDLTPIE